MQITFLGSGSAFVNSNENYQSNILIAKNGETLLFDAGTTINDALFDLNIPVEMIHNIYISHLHADHAGGIEYLAFKRYFSQMPFGINKAKLIGNVKILTDGWKHTWSGGIKNYSRKN